MSLEEITARLVAEHRAACAPVSVEHAVLAEFDAHRRQRRWRVAGAAALAGTLAAGAILVWDRPTPRRATVAQAPAPVVAHIAAAAAPEVTVRHPKHARVSPNVSAAAEAPFITIPYTAPPAPGENLRIVRMTLSASALAAVGFPLPAIDPEAGTPSDVLVGEDGRARAIRIIGNSNLR